MISMLQFADDTVFVGEASMENIMVIKCVLRCFELASGLKVNFNKSRLAGIAIDGNVVRRFSAVLHCKIMSLPSTYLGIPLGGGASNLALWEPVIKKIKARLSSWRQKSISFGGRITLIQSVLSSLPLFFLSFFKIPVGVAKTCTSIMRRFLWGGLDGENKIAWVKWTSVCKPKACGGLGIKDLVTFNKALLGKWKWCYLESSSSLWCRVLKAKYSDGTIIRRSPWWNDILSNCLVDGLDWFSAGTSKVLKCGNETSFWRENWAGQGAFYDKFHRLFNLSKQKSASVMNMGEWVDGTWRWKFGWRRPLAGREIIWLQQLIDEASSITLSEGLPDEWVWLPNPGGGYSVNSAYLFLQDNDKEDQVFKALWDAPAPSNVRAFAWRLILDRIPSRENLRKRGVISSSLEANCSLCNLVEESSSHLLFSCPVSLNIWNCSLRWLGWNLSATTNSRDHLVQFISSGRNKNQRMGVLAIWLAAVWSLWLTRNNMIFRDGLFDLEAVLDLIQWRSWSWIKEKMKGFSYSLADWKLSPATCLQSL